VLSQLQIFLTASDQIHDGLTSATATNPSLISFGTDAVEVFRLNNLAGTYRTILLDASLSCGSGGGDMFLYLRNDLFAGSTSQNVILYSEFCGSSGGFEEWAVLGGGPVAADSPAVPEPASLGLWFLGALGLGAAGLGHKRRAKSNCKVPGGMTRLTNRA
jgi:hypothetical protein